MEISIEKNKKYSRPGWAVVIRKNGKKYVHGFHYKADAVLLMNTLKELNANTMEQIFYSYVAEDYFQQEG